MQLIDEYLFSLYQSYVVNQAKVEGRAFRLPKKVESLTTRNDFMFFCKLRTLLKKNGYTTKREVSRFLNDAATILERGFYIVDLVSRFDELLVSIKKLEAEGRENDVCAKVKRSFLAIEEYCLLNKKPFDEMLEGSPPMVLKMWRKGEVDDIVAYYLTDINKLKRKAWAKMFCRKLIVAGSGIQDTIDGNIDLQVTLKKNLDILNKSPKLAVD